MHSISSGAPFGEEQPDEAGLELVPRDEVHAEALLQRQPDQIGDKMQFDEWNVFFV